MAQKSETIEVRCKPCGAIAHVPVGQAIALCDTCSSLLDVEAIAAAQTTAAPASTTMGEAQAPASLQDSHDADIIEMGMVLGFMCCYGTVALLLMAKHHAYLANHYDYLTTGKHFGYGWVYDVHPLWPLLPLLLVGTINLVALFMLPQLSARRPLKQTIVVTLLWAFATVSDIVLFGVWSANTHQYVYYERPPMSAAEHGIFFILVALFGCGSALWRYYSLSDRPGHAPTAATRETMRWHAGSVTAVSYLILLALIVLVPMIVARDTGSALDTISTTT